VAFKPPPAIIQRVLRFKSMKYTDGGGIKLWGIPAEFFMMYAEVYLQRLIEKEFGVKKASSLIYAKGSLQAGQGFKMISERFGYAKTIPDKKKLLEFNIGQTAMVGMGKSEWIKMDFENEVFVFKCNSTTAREYKRFFGTQKQSVDHFLRGGVNAYVEQALKKKTFTVETKCIAMGDKCCEFIIKPIDKWNKNDPLFKEQAIDKIPSIKEVGAKIEPYLVLYEE
jgi:predicted hydrocarbon binding protein